MKNRYTDVNFNRSDMEFLNNTELTNDDKLEIENMKKEHKEKIWYNSIEYMYIFNKAACPTSKIAEIYGVSPRQIQLIFKELGLQRLKTSKENKEVKAEKININEVELPEQLSDFLNYLDVIKGKSPNTINGYKVDLIMFFRFMKQYKKLVQKEEALENIYIGDIEDEFIRKVKLTDFYAFLSYVENKRNNSSYARARKVAALKSFFKYLNTKARIISENPTIDLESPKISKRHPVYLTLDESKTLLKSVTESDKNYKRDFCIITLFLNCGLRLSELCSINISSIKSDVLTIIGKGNKERTVYLNKACINAISDYMPERRKMEILPQYRDALFISSRKCRINKRTVEMIIGKYIEGAGLDSNKYSPHKLRHTAATLMYKYGNVDIRSLQAILGHENISTTQIYTHVDDENLRKAVSSNPLSNE